MRGTSFGTRHIAGALILLVSMSGLYGCAHLGRRASLRQECADLVRRSDDGDFKTAVEHWDELLSEGYSCPKGARDAVAVAAQRLDAADALVREAMELKKQGDLGAAARRLAMALEIYPRYHWVRKLQVGVQASIDAEVSTLLDEADYYRAAGDLETSLERLKEAGRLRPDDRTLAAAVDEVLLAIDDLEGRARARRSLELARTLVSQGRLTAARDLLLEADAQRYMGDQVGSMLKTVAGLRDSRAYDLYVRARATWRDGDLDGAAGLLKTALGHEPASAPLKGKVVETARLLGIKLFSSGSLVSAQGLWTAALAVDPGNTRLQRYLREVRERLGDLEEIKENQHREQ